MIRCQVHMLLAAFLCCPSVGCLAVYSTRPVDVLVTRTDTGEPAPGVPVKVHYLAMMVLNMPEAVEGTTDAGGRVTLQMADFRLGPYLQAGTTKYAAPSEVVRDGGSLTYKPSANPDEPVPTHSVRLLPRRKSLIQRLRDRELMGHLLANYNNRESIVGVVPLGTPMEQAEKKLAALGFTKSGDGENKGDDTRTWFHASESAGFACRRDVWADVLTQDGHVKDIQVRENFTGL
jgi:hypothetical protein